MLEKLSRLIVGTEVGAVHDATDMLTRCYIDCIKRARQLSRHAEMAPQAYGTQGLRDLAAAEEAQAERQREALRAIGAPIPPVADESLPAGALNHWGRLVQDLEAHRASARRLRELAIHFAEALPATAQLFEEMCRAEFAHAERLRTLIARADPQALD